MENSSNYKMCMEKLSEKYLFLQNNVQCKYFVDAIDSGPTSLQWIILCRYRWRSADIVNYETCQFELYGNSLAPIVHADLLLADITSMSHNLIFSRYLTWLGVFDFIGYMPILYCITLFK